ncbi:uncharacterized protein LOC134719148 [Mytilus trossulus]|uniref:uncharacterized protein LOC134719148 n=1 Tax=Mytilus trossulus TaxID=6551 RepID=UPI0030048B61
MSEELTEQDIQNIVRAFKDMKVKPNADTTDAFKNWMKEFSTSKMDDVLYMPYIPKLPIFSGDDKGDDVSYDLWRYQVACLIKENYRHEIIAQAIRRSVHGEASRIVMRLGVEATVDDVIDRMDCIFGSVDVKEVLLAQFYTACQGADEDVSSWGCRLEEILNKALQRGKIYEQDTDDMLRSKFWKGLRPELRKVSIHKFDRIKEFNQLLISMREIEEQHRQDSIIKIKSSTSLPDKENITSDETTELKAMVQKLTAQLQEKETRTATHTKNPSSTTTFIPDETIIHRPNDRNIRRKSDKGDSICWRCGQQGHIAVGCRVRLDNSRKVQHALNFQQVTFEEQHISSSLTTKEQRIAGTANEVTVFLNGMKTQGLLDTGSTVSTMSEDFYNKHCSAMPLEQLSGLLKIECADGLQLPYLGYVEAELQLEGITTPYMNTYPGLFLVVPDSDYNSTTPLLIGTNILSSVMEDISKAIGPRYLQDTNLYTPWYLAFRCLTLRNHELEKQHNRLAIVKSAEMKSITIPPNTEVVIKGYMDKKLEYPTSCALLHATRKTSLSTDLDIVPAIVNYNRHRKEPILVRISNITTRTVTVAPRSIICELQPVSIEELPPTEKSDVPDILDIVKLPTEILEDDELDRGKDLLNRFKDIFSTGDTDIGHTSAVKHRIDLVDNRPFKQRHRRIPPLMIDEVRNHLRQLLSAGIIRRSHSPWSSNVVLVRKKDGSLRMCVDYRQLNDITIKDSYALPRIEEILDSLGGNTFYTVLDMKSGYHQVEVLEEHKERTAFTVGPLGFFEYNRLPFGLANSPATYQRLMEECLGDLHTKICFIYLDDLIIFSKTVDEHFDRLERIFQRLREVGLKLSPKKCSLFQQRVKYIGHIVSAKGIEPDPEKIDKVMNWPRPTNPEEVRQFLGFVGYYRKFVRDFSKKARPLTDLMPSTSNKKGKGKKGQKKTSVEVKPWHWDKEQEDAFQELRHHLSNPPVLGFPEYQNPFELHTDACLTGLGAVLYQLQEGKKRVIAYASRGLSKSERNYPVHKLEFLALRWAICDKFNDYLYGAKFTVLTDNNPLTYVLSSAKLDATGHRWIAALSAFDFDIKYRPGKQNTDADALSRLPALLQRQECTPDESYSHISEISKIPITSVKAICSLLQRQPYIESLAKSTNVMEDIDIIGTDEKVDIRREQLRDPVIRYWIDNVMKKKSPRKEDIPAVPFHRLLHSNFNRLILKDGILFRRTTVDGESKDQLILPASQIKTVLNYLHNNMGHQGRDRTTSLVKDRYFWSGMHKDIEEWIQRCPRCLKRKRLPNDKAPLKSIKTSQPQEIVCMDFLTLETSKGGYHHVLVITDHFTRYAQAIPTKNMSAKTTAEAFFNNYVIHYGLPQRIHSDQGGNFESRLLKELCELTGIKKSRTTPYHPMGNGQCERFNRTLLNMLGTLQNDQKSNWKQYLGPIVHAYNCTKQDTTGYSPFSLMFGREPRLPIDTVFGIENITTQKNTTKYVEQLKDRLRKSYELALRSAEKAQSRQKKGYDEKIRGAVLNTGDRVLVKILAFEGKHKLSDRWENDPYIILEQPNSEIPVFVVRKENGEGRKRTLHRNLLLPIGSVSMDEQEPEDTPQPKPRLRPRKETKPVPKPRTTRREPLTKDPQPPASISSDTDSESEDESFMILITQPTDDTDISTNSDDDDNSEEPVAEVYEPQTDGDQQGVIGQEETEDTEDAPSSNETEDSVSEQPEEAVITEEVELEEAVSSDEPGQEDEQDEQDEIQDIPRRSVRTKTSTATTKYKDFVCKQIQPNTDWLIRAQFLKDAVSSGVFRGSEDRVKDALLKIVTDTG